MHELVSSAGEIKITPELQYMPGQDTVRRTFQINFGQVYLAKPTAREKDGYVRFVFLPLVHRKNAKILESVFSCWVGGGSLGCSSLKATACQRHSSW